MRNYIILNGKNSNEINGLLIQELPPISKPLIRTEVEEIDGRDGDIVTPLGYSAYDKEFTIGLYKDFDANEVAAYFNSEGTVIFSNEPDKYYYYQITAQIDFERLVRYRTATVTMHCQPFKYSATEQPITEDVSGTVSDEGTNLALENTAEAPFNTLDLKGNTEQDTLSGKNLLTATNTGTQTKNGVTITFDGSSFTLNGTATASTDLYIHGGSWSDTTKFVALPAGTYTASIRKADMTLGADFGFKMYNSGSRIVDFNANEGQKTTTLSSDAGFTVFFITIVNGKSFNNEKFYFQLEKNSSATAWERYVGGTTSPNPDYPQAVKVVTGENVAKICGKNIFDALATPWVEKVAFNGSGQVRWNGYYGIEEYQPVKPSTTYTFSNSTGKPIRYGLAYYDSSKTMLSTIVGNTTTFTTPANCHFIRFAIQNNTAPEWTQLELGSSASDYEEYQGQSYPISLGSIELCNIPDTDYRDRFIPRDGKWYLHKEVGKYVFNGAEAWSQSSRTTANMYVGALNIVSLEITADEAKNKSLANRAINASTGVVGSFAIFNTSSGVSQYICYAVSSSYASSLAQFKEKLATDNLIVYAPLATPTDTEITNEALIEQLNDIYYHAHAYKGRTHITSSAATGNVPHIIAAEVGEDNESTITNAGNYLSKPKITVYGSGDISLYINDMHVLQITLGDEGYITIDTAQMEAYKDTLDNLKNRLVIGDYSNARLKPGANKIHFTGTITKYVVENYSRWL